ncbi:MAG: TrkA family potassium uptake protein [Clostridia bacterium]|nr:TrkA family potassium uptake protein [Clostridia bacterium]
MKSVLLVGVGRFGQRIADRLIEMKHEVLAVDVNEENINDIMPVVTDAQIGDCTDKKFLTSIGVDNFDVCFVTIRNDFQNSLQTTSLLKELGAKKVVAVANNDVHSKFLLRNGADAVIDPEKQLALWAAITYTSDNVFDYVRIDDKFSIFEVSIPESWDGITVGKLGIRQKYGINIMAIKANDELDITITPDTVLDKDNHLLVLGSLKSVRKCFDI